MRLLMPSLNALLNDPRYHRTWRGLLLLLMAVVSWFAFAPDPGGSGFAHADKLNHMLAFGVLGGTAVLTGHASAARLGRVALALVAYGAFIEVVQSYLPTRQGDWLDLLADAAGIGLGVCLVVLLRRRWAAPVPSR
ncbi:MAG: VanZ family protein [Rubrivivax sp.]|jgi:VanZ family protein|nr:VanZ family protein [Rubrivivax sp.]